MWNAFHRIFDFPRRCMEVMQGDACVCGAHLDDKERVVPHRQLHAPTGPARGVQASMVDKNGEHADVCIHAKADMVQVHACSIANVRIMDPRWGRADCTSTERVFAVRLP